MFTLETPIMVVDDMMTMRKIVRKCLTELGYKNIVEANDGSMAWPMLETAHNLGQPFGLVISDWNMPQMKGIDLLKHIRAHSGMSTTPVIMVTAETEKTQIAEALKAGASSYVVKPFSTAILQEKIVAVWNNMVAKSKAAKAA